MSRNLLAIRLEAFWITVARVRALCLECNGHDPDFENFDQTPYHFNESGSQDGSTLGVCGELCPLVEGHAATRMRWSANLGTFSDAERITDGKETPYAEFMFKFVDKTGKMELRLRNHIHNRGYGKWVSVACSSSGSYGEDEILAFLETHLPHHNPQLRGWRIMLCDDFAAHKTDNCRRLCWSRGYVLLIIPGGATPFVQTCDVALNQHVRRDYVHKETMELIRCFKRGQVVPSLQPEQMIDIMVEVLSQKSIHLRAAESYKET